MGQPTPRECETNTLLNPLTNGISKIVRCPDAFSTSILGKYTFTNIYFLLICPKGLGFLGESSHGQGFASLTHYCSTHCVLSLACHPLPVPCENCEPSVVCQPPILSHLVHTCKLPLCLLSLSPSFCTACATKCV